MSEQAPKPSSNSVLVVEDDRFTSQLLQFLLQREKYQVHVVEDGQAGLEFIQDHPPTSIVIMDIMLPYIDGLELLRHMRAHPDWCQARIVMLSAKTQGSDIARALDAGADDYLIKPFNPEELFARVRRYRGSSHRAG